MKAYLVDPLERQVSQIEFEGDWRTINELIGSDTFDIMPMENGDCVFVDDEGLLKPFSLFDLFLIEGYYPLVGKGLVLGSDAEGESVSPHITFDEFRAKVRFVPEFNPANF